MDTPIPDTPGHNDPGEGRRLGVDVGTVRIGLAISDRASSIATPLETVRRVSKLHGPSLEDIERILAIIAEYEVVEVVVGLPRNLKGHGSASVDQAVSIARRLRAGLGEASRTVVRFGDERLTTVLATQAMRMSGVSQRKGRSRVDQAAAVEILQSWLDRRKREIGEPMVTNWSQDGNVFGD